MGASAYDEYKAVSAKRIERFSRHHDGKLAADDRPTSGEVMIKARFYAIAANHDGAIDETEMDQPPRVHAGKPRS